MWHDLNGFEYTLILRKYIFNKQWLFFRNKFYNLIGVLLCSKQDAFSWIGKTNMLSTFHKMKRWIYIKLQKCKNKITWSKQNKNASQVCDVLLHQNIFKGFRESEVLKYCIKLKMDKAYEVFISFRRLVMKKYFFSKLEILYKMINVTMGCVLYYLSIYMYQIEIDRN